MIPFRASRRQLSVLRFVQGYQLAHHGVSPSLREIAEGVGTLNKKAVWRVLRQLERLGAVRRLFNRERAIELLVPVAVPRAPDGAPLFHIPVPLPVRQPAQN